MDVAKPARTDQQDTNAALAALAAAGNSFALGQLWEINKGVLHRLFWQWYNKNKAVADNAGLTLEDFDQESFFAVQAAAKAYNPSKGAFSTLLGYYVQNQINKAVFGEHSRTITAEDGREVRVSANPLNDCTSLDIPLNADDGGSDTLGDLQSDPAASAAMQAAEDTVYNEELHAALEEALNKLADRESAVIRRHYYDGQSLKEIGTEYGVSAGRIQQLERNGFQSLRKMADLRRWRDEIISTKAWSGTGFGAWYHRGSVEERAIEYLEDWEAKSLAWAAEREKLIREHYAEFEASGYFDRHPEQRPEL